jgi:transmembrane sensor
MNKEKYQALLAKYLNGECSDEERALLDLWYDALEGDAQSKYSQNTEGGDKFVFEKNWSLLKTTIETEKEIIKPLWTWRHWAAAASLLFAVSVSSYLWLKPKGIVGQNTDKTTAHVLSKNTKLVEKTNTTSQIMRVVLSDNSVVMLKPNSILRYAEIFEGEKREVKLEGEAFFDVTKNPQKPFFVYTNDVVTKVLGTSFTIKSSKDSKNVTVDVRTGRVSVYSEKMIQAKSKSDPETIGVVLTPNQSVHYLSVENRLVKSLVEAPVVLISKEELKKFTFNNAPIAQIFTAMEQIYGVDIIYDEEVMQDCTMTTSLEEENLHDKLTIICKLLGATHKMVDAQIVITSKGCY